MTERVKRMYDLVRKGEYKSQRINNENYDLSDVYLADPVCYDSLALVDMLGKETPFLLDECDIFGFNRRNVYNPFYYNEKGKKRKSAIGNLTPNYEKTIRGGFEATLCEIEKYEKENRDSDAERFYGMMKKDIYAVIDICERYRQCAEKAGNKMLADALSRIPKKGAESFYEACLFFKIITYTLRCVEHPHITVGRFDQYMYPYFKKDIESGKSVDELFEILELLFISLNIDGDLYYGAQTGDNGQSMVLGGYDKDGNDCFNELSRLCLIASRELKMIDPKINLRVSKKTPMELYELGTSLTKVGLGFPQYCNDDVIVPYMISLGYDEEDAYNYTVAACWEVISSGNGADVPNATSFNLPKVVNNALFAHLGDCDSFDEFMGYVREEAEKEAEIEIEKYANGKERQRAQYLSVFIDGCIEKGKDISEGGAKYYNSGTHGTGISNAADALAAIKKTVFEDKTVSADELVSALEADFEGYEKLRNVLRSCPKMGNNDDYVDSLADRLIDIYSEVFHGRDNKRGGVWRAGAGSALNYYVQAKDTGATADGRLAGDYFSCSFSPAITTKTNGPLSVIQSFTKSDLKKICNGGPLTMELHDSVFRNEEGEKKVAILPKLFVDRGGHQLQLNSINRDVLLKAKETPDEYRNLIVRVWGWSGYFCELGEQYQDHIIRRTEFTV